MQVESGDELLREERAEARRLGVSAEDLPFVMVPPGAEAAVLLVHGFSATPWEMLPLAEALAGRGFACLAVRLPGHGTTPEDLAGRRFEEWLAAVVAGYDRLAGRFTRIYAAGLSTGALLVLLLAGQRPLAGMVLLSPYLRLRHRLAPFAGWLRFFRPYQLRTLSDAAALHYYSRRPLAGVHQINRLLRRLAPQLGRLRPPVLAIHGEGDEVVDVESGRQLVERLGCADKRYRRYGPEVPHVLTAPKNPRQREVLEVITDFLQELERGGVVSSCR